MPAGRYAVSSRAGTRDGTGRSPKTPHTILISAQELWLLKRLEDVEGIADLSDLPFTADAEHMRLLWQRIERLLRQYAEYHFDRTIRSATLIDACFPVAVPSE